MVGSIDGKGPREWVSKKVKWRRQNRTKKTSSDQLKGGR